MIETNLHDDYMVVVAFKAGATIEHEVPFEGGKVLFEYDAEGSLVQIRLRGACRIKTLDDPDYERASGGENSFFRPSHLDESGEDPEGADEGAHQRGYARGVEHGTADERERVGRHLKNRANAWYHRAAPAGDADEEESAVLETKAESCMELAREVLDGEYEGVRKVETEKRG